MRWITVDDLDPDSAETWTKPGIDADTLAFLQYTSGSTQAPRGVMVSHGNLLHNSALIHRAFGYDADTRGMVWLPPYHDMGLIGGLLQPIYGGFPALLMSPVAFIQRPIRWLQAISRFRATASGGPNFAYDLCVQRTTPEQRAELDLSSWKLAFNGSEPVRHDTLERFAEAFAPCGFRPEAFFPCYGLAEATLLVSGGNGAASTPTVRWFSGRALEQNRLEETAAHAASSRPAVSSGRPADGLDVVIVHADTAQPCDDDAVGEIWVRGPSVAGGYWRRPDDTQACFQARLAMATAPSSARATSASFATASCSSPAGSATSSSSAAPTITRKTSNAACSRHTRGCAAGSAPPLPSNATVRNASSWFTRSTRRSPRTWARCSPRSAAPSPTNSTSKSMRSRCCARAACRAPRAARSSAAHAARPTSRERWPGVVASQDLRADVRRQSAHVGLQTLMARRDEVVARYGEAAFDRYRHYFESSLLTKEPATARIMATAMATAISNGNGTSADSNGNGNGAGHLIGVEPRPCGHGGRAPQRRADPALAGASSRRPPASRPRADRRRPAVLHLRPRFVADGQPDQRPRRLARQPAGADAGVGLPDRDRAVAAPGRRAERGARTARRCARRRAARHHRHRLPAPRRPRPRRVLAARLQPRRGRARDSRRPLERGRASTTPTPTRPAR